MKPDADDLILGIQAFLNQILDELPSARRGDARAAAKSLDNVRTELDVLFPLLMAECDDLAAACARAGEALGLGSPASPALPPCRSLAELKARHGEWLARLGDLSAELLGRGDDPHARGVLASICQTLGAHARSRLDWQSVFPRGALVSDVLRNTWPEDQST